MSGHAGAEAQQEEEITCQYRRLLTESMSVTRVITFTPFLLSCAAVFSGHIHPFMYYQDILNYQNN